jgi:hypothetical protein
MRPTQEQSRVKTRMIAGLLSAVGGMVLAMCLFMASAFAAPNPGPPTSGSPDGPQTANVPYVAWVGEHLRLVVCDPSITSNDQGGIQFANYQVEDWSGYQFQPPTPDGESGNSLGQIFDPGPAAFFSSTEPAHERDGCVATDYKSLNPGLARIRVDIRDHATGQMVFSHQFLVIWLTIGEVKLHEAALAASGSEVFQSQLNGQGQSNFTRFLGDPSGNGQFIPSPFESNLGKEQDKGLIQIKVTGSFPVVSEAPLHNILPNPSYTLPTDWQTLAQTLSSSSEETEPPGSEPKLWDIHGTPGEASTQNAGSSVNDPLHDAFYRPAFGNNTSGATSTVGPYDPQAANETLLSDGQLNENDAPMPSLRVDVALAGNKGGSDLGGVGQIEGASKAQIYSHDFTGNAEPEGNLYNPYYGAYIPATDRPGVNEVSGIDGPSPGGSFPGFLNEHPTPYTFWQSVKNGNNRSAESTGCLRRINASPSTYETPSGYSNETFYTDERGEAYLVYTPGDGFYLNHIPLFTGAEGESEQGKIIKNEDGACDLKGLYGEVIGESTISASGIYPYEPVDYTPVAATESVTKKVTSAWEKEWFQFPKGPGENEQNVRIVVAKAQDIDGRPLAGETVCFHASGASVAAFTGTVLDTSGQLKLGAGATVSLAGTEVVHPTGYEGLFCETTNSQGLAGLELDDSSTPQADLTATYVSESGIIRDHEVSFTGNQASKEEAAAKKKQEEEAAAKKVQEEEAAAKKKAEEKAAAEKRFQEEEAATKKKHAEEVAALKTTEEKEAAEKKFNEEEAATKKKHEEEVAALATPVTTVTNYTTTVLSAPLPSLVPLGAPAPAPAQTAPKPLTAAQKFARALKACKSKPRKKRLACEAQARRAAKTSKRTK